MKLSKFIEQVKDLNYDIFVSNKNKLPQGQVPDEVDVYSTNVGIEPKIIEVNGKIVIQ